MMLQGSYRAVIEGPARLTEPPLKIDPLLTDALLKDISGQDALPLLAFTLAHLYDNYRADKQLTLAGYDRIGRVECAAYSPDGSRIVTAFADDTARIWDAASGQPIGEPLKSPGGFGSVAFSLDGTRIVTENSGGTQIWDAVTGTPIGAFKGDRNRKDVYSARFSPDGKQYVDVTDADTVRILDNATDGQIVAFGHDVLSAAFSPDGKRVVTASIDGTAQVWNSATGKPVGKPLKGHEDRVYTAAFSPDGKHIVTASQDKTARIWDVVPDTQSLVEAAKAAVPRCLKPEQRKAVFLPAHCA